MTPALWSSLLFKGTLSLSYKHCRLRRVTIADRSHEHKRINDQKSNYATHKDLDTLTQLLALAQRTERADPLTGPNHVSELRASKLRDVFLT